VRDDTASESLHSTTSTSTSSISSGSTDIGPVIVNLVSKGHLRYKIDFFKNSNISLKSFLYQLFFGDIHIFVKHYTENKNLLV
jgi:hypothetical protein